MTEPLTSNQLAAQIRQKAQGTMDCPFWMHVADAIERLTRELESLKRDCEEKDELSDQLLSTCNRLRAALERIARGDVTLGAPTAQRVADMQAGFAVAQRIAREALGSCEAQSLASHVIDENAEGSLLNATFNKDEDSSHAKRTADSATAARSYVHEVPEHCDRIIWRGRYYTLQLLRPADETPVTLPRAEDIYPHGAGLSIGDETTPANLHICGTCGAEATSDQELIAIICGREDCPARNL